MPLSKRLLYRGTLALFLSLPVPGDVSVKGLSTSEALLKVVDLLRDGNPAIAKINNTDDHWVVIMSYSGNTSEISASQFTCADPWTGKPVDLNNATNYKGIYVLKYLYPQNK